MIGHKRVPSREGGVEVVVTELCKRMSNEGHEIFVYNRGGKPVCGKGFEKNSRNIGFENIRIITVPTLEMKGLAALTSSFFATLKAIFSKATVVHYHAEGPCAMLWLARLMGKKTIATIHGLDWQRSKWGRFASFYIRFGEATAAKYADEIIVLSANVKDYFKEVYKRDVKFIPNGVTPVRPVDADIIKEEWGLSKDSYILFLGRVVPEKGLHYLLEAYKGIETDKKLVVAGGSSDTYEYFRDLRNSEKGNERIIFTDFVEGRILEELYSNAYIYVLPSDLEGMPLSLLEAMSYGNCCLVSDIRECTEVVEDMAAVFKKADVWDLTASLEYLLNNPQEVNNYKANAAKFICGKYDWDNVTKETLLLYEALGLEKELTYG